MPARISDSLTKEAKDLAVCAFESLGCKGYARVDMFVEKDRVLLSEINTLPGLTENSLLPKAASAAGISFPHLLSTIIDFALDEE